MVKADLIASKLTELSDRVSRAQASCPRTAQELELDRDRLDLVSFNLMLAVQVSVDVASHIISDEGWPAPRSLAESFQRLKEHAVISESTANALTRAVGFRNVVAHGYGKVDVAMVFQAATRGIDDLRRYSMEVASWMRSLSGPA